MRCPICGRESRDKPNFCPTCGFELMEPTDRQPAIMHTKFKGWQNPMTFGFRILALGMVIVFAGERMFRIESFVIIGAITAFLGVGLIGLRGVLVALSQSRDLPWSKAQGVLTKKPPDVGEHPDSGFEESSETLRNPQPTS